MNLAKLASPSPAALNEGISIVRRVIGAQSKSGLTTSELYRLSLKESPTSSFKPSSPPTGSRAAFINPIPKPPHPEHPIYSKTFLKRAILPVLEGRREIQLVRTTRLRAVNQPKELAPGKATNKNATKQSAAPVPASPVTVWLWKPVDKATLPQPKPKSADVSPAKEDWGHLNKRRRASRIAKLRGVSH
ncbi:hypothetical protein ONZ45_g16969 [Pleurotus djamor]|nr:hypothetical protein ONZ45_g16969 [Pleurotus djamor]